MKYFVLVLALLSCAKQRDYEEVYKEKEVVSKSLIATIDDPNALSSVTVYNQGHKDFEAKVADNVYLYIPTLEQGGYYNSKATSYFMGSEKMVTFKFTKDALRVSAIEKDERYSGDDVNNKPILEVPLVHKDYRCKENSSKECSNKEEENKDISWDKKKFAELDFGKIKIFETNTLPIDLSNLFFPCYMEVDKKVSSWNITKDEVHIVIDKLFKTNVLCSNIQSLEDLENSTFSLKHHYQFKKLNKVSSKDYESLPYYGADQNKFGFFTTESKKLSADNREVYYSRKVMMNRFNPKKKEIPFYVSQNLLNSKNEDLLKATEEVFDIINESLVKAKTSMKLSLKKESREKNLHKLSNSIIMVEEPLAGGLLGYGPSVTNPMTGEIIQAQTVMYAGNHIKFIRRTYDELVRRHLSKKLPEEVPKEDVAATEESSQFEKMMKMESGVFAPLREEIFQQNLSFQESLEINEIARTFDQLKVKSYESQKTSESSLIDRLEHEINQVDPMKVLTKHNMFHHEYINLEKMMSQIMDETQMKETELKLWTYLGDSEREKIIGIILPQIWKQVLIHEIGHNLGLRHNFAGSEDKANFYTEDELAELGIDHKIPYSSVMDYGHSDLNSLPLMGKYDVAALKFSYARLIDGVDGSEIEIPESLAMLDPEVSKKIKSFEFCTDEHVYLNAMCNRFDEGTTVNEVVDHTISHYYKSYEAVNMKQDKLSFSSFHSLSSLRRKFHRTFFPLRKFFDQFERIRDYVIKGNIPADAPIVQEHGLAVSKIANFLMSVLKEHDALCKFIDIQTFQAIWVPLSNLSYASCSQISPIQGRYFPVAQTGVVQQDLKSQLNPSSYVNEIDVRGSWVDKFLALHTLSMKEHGIKSFDEQTDSFISLKVPYNSKGETVDQGVREVFDSLIDGATQKEVLVRNFDGSVEKELMLLSSKESDFIKRGESGVFNRVLGLRKSKTHLSKILLQTLIGNNNSYESSLSKPIVKDYIATKSESSSQRCVETQYGKVCFHPSSKKIIEIIEKAQASSQLKTMSSSHMKMIASELIKEESASSIMAKIEKSLRKSASELHTQYEAIFTQLISVSPEDVKAFLEKRLEDISSPDVASFLEPLPPQLIEAKAENLEASGEELAFAFLEKIEGKVSDQEKIIDTLDEFSKGVLKSISQGSLGDVAHYEKVLSSLAL